MTCWQILGITPTEDKRSIKRAYSKLLKVTRPEDDLEAFQSLNEAYELALVWDFNAESSEYDDSESVLEGAGLPESEPEPESEQVNQLAAEPEKQLQVECESEQVTQPELTLEQQKVSDVIGAVFDKFGQLLELEAQADWQAFFAQDEMNDLEYKPALGFEFFATIVNFVHEHNELPIPAGLGKALAEHFMWHEQELQLCQYFNSDAVGQTLILLKDVECEQEEVFIPPPAEPKKKKAFKARVKEWLHWFAVGYFLWFVIKVLIALASD